MLAHKIVRHAFLRMLENDVIFCRLTDWGNTENTKAWQKGKTQYNIQLISKANELPRYQNSYPSLKNHPESSHRNHQERSHQNQLPAVLLPAVLLPVVLLPGAFLLPAFLQENSQEPAKNIIKKTLRQEELMFLRYVTPSS